MTSPKHHPLRMVLCLQILLLSAVNGAERQRYCGPAITTMMQSLCKHTYASQTYNMRNDKRSDNAEHSDYIGEELLNYPPIAYQPYPLFATQFDSTSALNTRVRRDLWTVKRGIYDECCRNPCTKKQLTSYCGSVA